MEIDPEDVGVGYGGLPNEDGVVQLDASVMDGKTYNAGAVACIENIKTPCSVARIVMEKTDHVLLVGKGALEFALKWGFKKEDLLTEKARKIWLKWRENLNKNDDWGPPDHLRDLEMNAKIKNIAFNEVGAAGATGRGEDVIKSCATFYIVMRMKEGRTPQEACEDAIRMIVDKYKKINPKFFPGEKFIALNKKGEYGCALLIGKIPARMCVANEDGVKIHTGSVVFKRQ